MSDPLKTYFCRQPGCEREVKGEKGSGAYCSEHRAMRAAAATGRAATKKNENGLVAKLDSLKVLAREADKLEAKATSLRAAADKAAFAVGEKRDAFAERMRELSQ